MVSNSLTLTKICLTERRQYEPRLSRHDEIALHCGVKPWGAKCISTPFSTTPIGVAELSQPACLLTSRQLLPSKPRIRLGISDEAPENSMISTSYRGRVAYGRGDIPLPFYYDHVNEGRPPDSNAPLLNLPVEILGEILGHISREVIGFSCFGQL